MSKLEAKIDVEQEVDLRGQKTLLVEEIVATGMHFKMAKDVVENKWNAGEVRTATLVWKTPTIFEPDYYIVKPGRFVWFQFPWSRLGDYVQFIRVVLTEESREERKFIQSEDEIKERFKLWYGSKPDARYLKEALNVLRRDQAIEPLSGDKISVILPTD